MIATAQSLRLAVVVLISMIVARGLLLEYTDLLDPTEARYATIAQEMVLSGDWLTPKLPSAEGIIPYLGKPPLHFWITAFFYRFFAVEEWTSRLPSFLAALLTLFFIVRFARTNFGSEVGLLSPLILFSSGVFFLLAGASITDMTLTASVTGAIVSFYSYTTERSPPRFSWLIGALASGLAFLCKGPVALVLIALPFILWSGVRKDFRWMRRLPWIRVVAIFLALVLPWFIANQARNPEFLRYFIWNENIARYLFRDYGDKYGTGHRHPYGMSWIMLGSAFAPWSLLLLFGVFTRSIRRSWQWLNSDSSRLFCFLWGISAALFFTFVRQLHVMYLLPALPPLAILTASLCSSSYPSWQSNLKWTRSISIYLFGVLSIGTLITGAVLSFSISALFLGLTLCAIGIFVLYLIKDLSQTSNAVALSSSLLVCVYVTVIVCLSPYVDQRQSATSILKDISKLGIERVEVLGRKSYSHYWASKAWHNELGNKVSVTYLDKADLVDQKPRYLLVKRNLKSRPFLLENRFYMVLEKGYWELYQRKQV